MIRLITKYDPADPTAKGNWVLTDKAIFYSGKKSWRRSSYYLSTPMLKDFVVNRFTSTHAGYNAPIIGGKCLSVWSK